MLHVEQIPRSFFAQNHCFNLLLLNKKIELLIKNDMKTQALFNAASQPAAQAATWCCVTPQVGCHTASKSAHCHSNGYVEVATPGAIGHPTSPIAKTSKFTEPFAASPHHSTRNAALTYGSNDASFNEGGCKRPKQETYTISGIKTTTPWKTLHLSIYVVDDKFVLKH